MIRTKCLICGDENIKKIIRFGMHSTADTFIPQERLDESEPVYPLELNLCDICGNIQLAHITDAMKRYNLYDYSYTSSNSDFSRKHWKKYADDMISLLKLNKEDFILEIGSNDGFLLKCFRDLGYNNILGIDPSKIMVKKAKEEFNIDTIEDIFPFENEENYSLLKQKPKIIIANNVFNHSNDPLQFVKKVRDILDDNGVFVFELPYWGESVKSFHYEQAYLEHVSYFTVESAWNILEYGGMWMHRTEMIPYHGGSIRVYSSKQFEDSEIENYDVIDKYIDDEHRYGLFSVDFYSKWSKEIEERRNKFLKKILDIKLNGGKIVAVGSAAKGNTFLTYSRLDNTLIDYVTDSSSSKQGKRTPLTRIPIVGDDILKQYDKVYCIILAWNLGEGLKNKILSINPNVEFLCMGEE